VEPTLVVSYGAAGADAAMARIVATKQQTWREYARTLADPVVGEDKAIRGWSVPAKFSPSYRHGENLVARYALTFDYDHVTDADLETIRKTYEPLEYLAYTTFSHTPERPRWRFVFPLSRAATHDEFQAVSRRIAARAGIELTAGESHKSSQMMFLPVVRAKELFQKRYNRGAWVDVDAVLAEFEDWTDRTQWPRRREGDGVHEDGETVDPTTKPGVIGDFCRAYPISEAIAAFDLPYVHVRDNRWTYTLGSRPEGVVIYDEDKKAQSHHDTDPARGQTNAFDLVRLHKFSGLDGEAFTDVPITERPSFREMARLAAADPRVQREAALAAFEDLGPATDPPAVEKPAVAALARPLSVVLTTPTHPRWLIRDELERGVMALMAGPRGSYKSFKALHWAMTCSVAGYPVYVVSAEGGDFERRAAAWMLHHDVVVAPPLYVVEKRLDLNSREGVETIRQDCLRLNIRPALFVLDTFSKLSGGLDENDNSQVKSFIGRLDNGLKRPDAFDATVLLVAHTGHSDTSRARGASALEADTDAAYIVNRDNGTGTVRISRERFKSSSELPPLVYKPTIVALNRLDDEGLPVTSIVLEPTDANAANSGSRRPRGKNQKHLWQVLAELAPDGMGVPVDGLLDAAVERLPVDSKGRDTRRQNMRQALEAMTVDGLIFKHGNTVSTTQVVVSEEWLDV
jgi:hypothetical protein